MLYGAYGSNMNLYQMSKRCPSAQVIAIGKLKNYKLTFRGSGVANVEQHKGDTVPIVVWDITPNCEKALDRYEGYPTLYTKKNVVVVTKDGRQLNVMVYVMATKYELIPCLPNNYYYNIILQGYKDNGIDTFHLNQSLLRTRTEVEDDVCKNIGVQDYIKFKTKGFVNKI